MIVCPSTACVELALVISGIVSLSTHRGVGTIQPPGCGPEPPPATLDRPVK